MDEEILKHDPIDRAACNGIRTVVVLDRFARERWRIEQACLRAPFDAVNSGFMDELTVLGEDIDKVLVDFMRSGELLALLEGAA